MQGLTTEDVYAAIQDPAYHRHLLFSDSDKLLQAQLKRPLLQHETQGKLRGPQQEVMERVEKAMACKDGEIITVLFSRQTGKNEVEAMLECRALSIFHGIPESKWIRTAPTWKPQIVNSKHRLEKCLDQDPLIQMAGGYRPREGFIYQSGHCQVMFLSGGATSNVVGATASLCLSVDEAHKIDAGKFEEDFMPFTASTNAPSVLFGVAADELDLLHEYRSLNEGTDRSIVVPWDVWAEESPAYAAHCAGRVKKLGESHPVWLTQYCLKAVQSIGGYLSPKQQASLFSGEHPPLERPREGMRYGLLIDVGGESEIDADPATIMELEPGRDYTWVWVFEWDPRQRWDLYPEIRIVNAHWWPGVEHLGLVPTLVKLCKWWNVSSGVGDARGVGEALINGLSKHIPGILAYKASQMTASEDCFDLLARINAGTVLMWKGATSDEATARAYPLHQEAMLEARHTKYKITGHEYMNLCKPTGLGSTAKHIDAIKALTYLHRALKQPHVGLMAHMQQELEKQQEEKDGTA